jgi:hypothetical protein
MDRFSSAREAKEFLVSTIVDEAQRENMPLSDLERKMLYFSENYSSLPDIMDISDEFDRTYDLGEYENKIARLIKSAGKRIHKESHEEYKKWWDAVRILKKEDHYILVMVKRAGLRPPGDALKLWGTGCAVVTFFIAAMLLSFIISDKYRIDVGRYVPSGDLLRLYIWATAVSILIAYGILCFVLGKQRTDGLLGNLFQKLFRLPKNQKPRN